MLSPEYIASESFKAAARASEEGKVPFTTWPEDIAAFKRAGSFPFPFLGYYVPDGWTLDETYLVDSSGFDPNDAGGPALSLNAFFRLLEEFVGKGWAVREAGEFQVLIGRYTRQR